MTKGEWAGLLAGAAVAALWAQAAISAARGVGSAFSRAPGLVKLACVAGVAATVLGIWQSAEDDAKGQRRA
jgi:integral membrane sensor domain MASE1